MARRTMTSSIAAATPDSCRRARSGAMLVRLCASTLRTARLWRLGTLPGSALTDLSCEATHFTRRVPRQGVRGPKADCTQSARPISRRMSKLRANQWSMESWPGRWLVGLVLSLRCSISLLLLTEVKHKAMHHLTPAMMSQVDTFKLTVNLTVSSQRCLLV